MSFFSKNKPTNRAPQSSAHRSSGGAAKDGGLIGVIATAQALAEVEPEVWALPGFLKPGIDETHREALGRYLNAGVELVLVLGSDALVGDVLTLHRRDFRTHRTPLNLAVMEVGAPHTVADALGFGAPSLKACSQLKDALQKGALSRRRLPTLRVTSSSLPAAHYGFACGAGLFYRIFETFHRHTGGIAAAGSVLSRVARRLITGGSSGFESVQARLSVDGQPHAEAFGFWLAGSLDSSWFGLNLGEGGAGFRSGETPRELLGQVAKSRMRPSFLRAIRPVEGDVVIDFGCIHMDGSAGYVLDGELFDPDKPYMLQIEPGAPALFYTL